MDFHKFRDAVEKQFNNVTKHQLVRVDLSKDDVYENYLAFFPEGTNNVFKERQEYDCNTCKQFIRNIGGVVAIDSHLKIHTVWDITTGVETYDIVAERMANLVKNAAISSYFLSSEPKYGAAKTHQILENGDVKSWNHFSCSIPSQFFVHDGTLDAKLGRMNTARSVTYRSLSEIHIDAVEIVQDLIAQNSLYRGAEFKAAIFAFKKMKEQFDKLTPSKQILFSWVNGTKPAAQIRNTVIGTLLTALSDGEDLNSAVAAFETKVAPANYKRSSAPITKGMIAKAVQTIDELGLESALHRRFANIEDVSVNNVLFADRDVQSHMKDSLTSLLMTQAKKSGKAVAKGIEEISISDFIENVLPTAESMEVLVDNVHENNLVSIFTAKHPDSKPLFKWDNTFSWSYNGNVTDSSIKQAVKNAGGNVTGDLRISLGWRNLDDLDLHVEQPNHFTIYHGHRYNVTTGGKLDVDMNVTSPVRNAVENVTYPSRTKLKKGQKLIVKVKNFTHRENTDVGFTIEIEYDGVIQTFTYNRMVRGREIISVAEITYDGTTFSVRPLDKNIESSAQPKSVWGINTQAFHKVHNMMLSPNYWDGKEIGNKHYFFILEGCRNPDAARGVYNEFLKSELEEHRKVFEVLGDQLKAQPTEDQLSGLGFSSTKRAELVCKVSGSHTRILKIKF